MSAISKPLPTQSWAIAIKDFETGEIEWISYTERKHETTYGGNLQWTSQLKLEHFADPIYSDEENPLFKKRPSKGEKILVNGGGQSGVTTGRKTGKINRGAEAKSKKNASIQQPK
ncbi:hypothetical protein GCK72_008599 [Caenorhabditis remanei]|uniref:Uncharacterized protein n=1 Tax=Caenorhabditis remanei TaxID=31234 RepID=A0A6A5GXY9_CAERE|nr:hypothetical protein GCK72_008599 [Caenorhabditis remanei]KAF1760350.1 hypothetical protein GCK72_008599 [Caenorhabditis remanei]